MPVLQFKGSDNLTQPQFKEWIGQTVGKEGEDATRHDKWCCMMYPRLQLLKELLRDDGAIFVSIDDNEIAALRLLMEEIFGSENFVATIIWRNSKIGEYKGTSYYLLYTPDGKKDRALDLDWLASLDKTEKNRRIVVYCEKIWVHRDDLAKYEAETKRTVRPMLVPFSLK